MNAEDIPTELPGGVQRDPDPAPADPAAADTPASPYATVPLGSTGGALATAGAIDPATGRAAAPTAQLSPKARRLVIGGGIAIGAAFALIIGLTIAFNVISSTVFSPEKQVEAYLGALQDGDAATAVELSAPNVPTAEQALLTNAITGAAEDRISGYKITDSQERGDDAVEITAEITQDGVTSTHYFEVVRNGRTAVVFPEWTLGETEYAFIALEIPEGAATVLVNEQEVPVEDLALEDGIAVAAVLPGQYTVALPPISDLVDSEPVSLYVTAEPEALSEGWHELLAAPTYTLTEAGVTEVQGQVNAAIDECATATVAAPEGCPFNSWGSSGEVEGSGSWAIGTYPTVEVEPRQDGWRVFSSEAPGEATYSYQEEAWIEGDAPTDETRVESIHISGMVTLAEDGTLAVDLSGSGG